MLRFYCLLTRLRLTGIFLLTHLWARCSIDLILLTANVNLRKKIFDLVPGHLNPFPPGNDQEVVMLSARQVMTEGKKIPWYIIRVITNFLELKL